MDETPSLIREKKRKTEIDFKFVLFVRKIQNQKLL